MNTQVSETPRTTVGGPHGRRGSATRPVSRGVRLRVLASVAILQAAVILWLLPSDPVTAYRVWAALGLTRRERVSPPVLPPAAPAPLGRILPLDAGGRRVRSAAGRRGPCLVVPVGDCSGCISVDLAQWERSAAERDLRLVLLSTAAPALAKRTAREHRLLAPVVSDTSGRLAVWLNASWPARPYLFSREWRLVWAGPAPVRDYDPFGDRAFAAMLGRARR